MSEEDEAVTRTVFEAKSITPSGREVEGPGLIVVETPGWDATRHMLAVADALEAAAREVRAVAPLRAGDEPVKPGQSWPHLGPFDPPPNVRVLYDTGARGALPYLVRSAGGTGWHWCDTYCTTLAVGGQCTRWSPTDWVTATCFATGRLVVLQVTG